MKELDNAPLDGFALKLDRVSLKDQAADLLRESIISGKVEPGSKLVERKVAEMLGISRAPARDALMQLEAEGLIVSKPDARYVINLTEQDIDQMHQVRLVLERLAVDLAAQNTNPANQEHQLAALRQMEAAVANEDHGAFARADLQGHTLIWQQANNQHLEKSLLSMMGPIFMFMANAAEFYDWRETLELHRDMVCWINAGERARACQSIERHMENSRQRALGVLKSRK
ncbi:MAG: GntR family transcriptional regulator [Anaerolineae bacterium]|nr:GntR family transcriptional regulator [Anaerolineae bacterium]